MPELLGLQALRALGAHDVCRYRSRELNFTHPDGKKQQLTVPAARDQPQLWLLPHDISMQWRISLFFSPEASEYIIQQRGVGQADA